MGLSDIGESLPPSFRFYPSDDELICHYLYKKVTDEEVVRGTLVDVDLHVCEPWQLPAVPRRMTFFIFIICMLSCVGARSLTDHSDFGYVIPPTAAPAVDVSHTPVLTVFTWLGNIASAFLYLAPLRTFWLIRREGTTAGHDSAPYVVTFFSCLLWAYYGVLNNSNFLKLNNCLGMIIQLLYVAGYLFYSARPTQFRTGITFLGVLAISTTILVGTSYIHGSLAIVVVEWIAAISSGMVSASFLTAIVRAFREHTVAHMPLTLICAVTFSQFSWTMYGVFSLDMILAYPNGFGCFLGCAQIFGYIIIRFRYGGVPIPSE